MSNDFPYNNGTRGPWYTSSADDANLSATSADGLGGSSDWNQFMQWDPAASQQSADVKPLNPQGPVCMLKSEQRTPLINRRQNVQSPETTLGLTPGSIPISAPLQAQVSDAPYTFGGHVHNPPAFDFDANTLSSPSSGVAPQQSGIISPHMWVEQDHRNGSLFSPPGFERPNVSTVHAPPVQTPSLHHSPSSVNNGPTSSSSATSSPEPMPVNAKKRKSTSVEDDHESVAKKDKQQPVKKTAHNMIEKRYRTNLNDKIAALRDSVPSLRVMSRPNGGNEEDDDPEDLEGLTPAHKLNKATVLSKATEYIRHLEKMNKRQKEEIQTLKGRLQSYENMAITGQISLHGSASSPEGSRYQEDAFYHVPPMMQQAVSGPPQGLIPVPESMANLHRNHPPQPHYAPQSGVYTPFTGAPRPGVQGPPMVNGRRTSGAIGKLMVGSLAGLMILEGLTEREQSSEEPAGRGLFALPIDIATLLAPRLSVGVASVHIPIAKLLLVFGAVFYLIAPLLDFKPKSKKRSVAEVQLSRAPSLASPVEVRRQAWLTAIQTVWVPGHNFWLEVAALGLKTLKLSTRKIIGWQGYAFLTGITKEQEAARVKAWNIALDAQLTGGDAEISKSRLVLTLMASGTLPDTPARLMLKALHMRVLLWELANSGWGGWSILDDLSAKVARSYWNAARSEQKIAVNMASKPDSEAEPLSEHLSALLEMECDDVLIPSVIQRAYNLAWNRPNAEHTTVDAAMDSVVVDFAICSPLDALAAWWSCHVLNKGLASCLASKNCTPKEDVKCDLELAARTAPPTSQAHLRALVARAVVLHEDRAKHIAAAYQALPSSPLTVTARDMQKPSRAMLVNPIADTPIATDIRKALTLAKCHVLADSESTEARCRAIYMVNNTTLPEATTTLLSFVAGYKVLGYFVQDPVLQSEASHGLERLASSLRMWVGHETGRRSGLSNKIRGRIVSHCLDASKTLVGLAEPEEVDDGYVSSSVKDD
jgi:hypothetical protein